jgi:hypothetical protein
MLKSISNRSLKRGNHFKSRRCCDFHPRIDMVSCLDLKKIQSTLFVRPRCVYVGFPHRLKGKPRTELTEAPASPLQNPPPPAKNQPDSGDIKLLRQQIQLHMAKMWRCSYSDGASRSHSGCSSRDGEVLTNITLQLFS